jgi:hypothetical protein
MLLAAGRNLGLLSFLSASFLTFEICKKVELEPIKP